MLISREKINLIDGTPMGIKVYEAFHEAAHFHSDCLEVVFCARGELNIRIAYEELTVKEGEIILIDTDDVHCISSDGENLLISFYIDQTSQLFGDGDLVNMSFVCHKGEIHPSMEKKIDYMHKLLLTMFYTYISSRYSEYEKKQIINRTAVRIMDIVQENFSVFYWMNDPNQFPDDAKARFEHIFAYIYKNTKGRMTIEELGALEHINPNYLSQFLKKTSFLGLRGLRTYIRVYKAELLLLTTDMSITDISYQCGFSDPKYFYRAFRQWYGHTPLNHRKLYREYALSNVDNREIDIVEIRDELDDLISYYQAELQLKLSDIK